MKNDLKKTQERVCFRLILMPCCGHMFCNVNHRWPSYCPCCGTYVFDTIRGCASLIDENATLTYHVPKE